MSKQLLQQQLERSKQLTSHIVSNMTDTIDRPLEQIQAQTNRLYQRTAVRSDADGPGQTTINSRAAFLLANKGFDAERVAENLDNMNLALSFEPLQGLPDTDIQGFLKNEHENIVSCAIEEQKNQTIEDFQLHFDRMIQKEWTRVKRKIMEEMGHQTNFEDMEQDDITRGCIFYLYSFSTTSCSIRIRPLDW